MMARTTSSTSTETSRLVARKAAKPRLEIGVGLLEPDRHRTISSRPVQRARAGAPGAAEIGELRLDAFDVEPDQPRRRQTPARPSPAGSAAPTKRIASSDSTSSFLRGIDALRPDRTAPAQSSAWSAAARRLAPAGLPGKAVHRQDELLGALAYSRSSTFITASCTCAETIARSSSSSATSFSMSRSATVQQSPQLRSALITTSVMRSGAEGATGGWGCALSLDERGGRCRAPQREAAASRRARPAPRAAPRRPTGNGSSRAARYPVMRSISAPQPDSFSSSRSKPRSRW